MNHSLTSYLPLPLIQAPEIRVETLWILGICFLGISVVYVLGIFVMRNRLSAKRKVIRQRKTELSPMISNFLFYDPETETDGREEYIRMKIEIRELLKDDFNRKVLTEVLLDLKSDVSGSARQRLLDLYQNLGLHKDAFEKLESWSWVKISQGINELTEMQVEQAYSQIRRFINDKRGVIRKQAQLATVSLKEEGIAYFMDTARYRISEWQQIKLMEILRQWEDFDPPRFQAWLTSENRDVVLFALRLIRQYRQNEAEAAIVTLLQHRKQPVRLAAVECIREFRFSAARPALKTLFSRSNEALKLQILEAMSVLGRTEDLPFLEQVGSKDGNFIIRSKSRAVMNILQPGSVLPTSEIAPLSPEELFPEETQEPTASTLQPECERPVADQPADAPEAMPEMAPDVEIQNGIETHEIPAETRTEDMEGFDGTTHHPAPVAPPEAAVEPEPDTAASIPEPALEIESLPTETEPSEEVPVAQVEAAETDLDNAPEMAESDPLSLVEEPDQPLAQLEVVVPEAPLDEWDEALFDLCLRQELADILQQAGVGGEQAPQVPDFIPLVIESQEEEPSTGVASWLADIPVIFETVTADSPISPSGQPIATNPEASEKTIGLEPECPVEPLPQEQALETEIPITPEPPPGGGPAPAFELEQQPENRIVDLTEGYFQAGLPDLERFSIFAEFFRTYGTESKLILLEEIPEVGSVKELLFLKGLLRDEDPRIRQKAQWAVATLQERLGTLEPGAPEAELAHCLELNFIPLGFPEAGDTAPSKHNSQNPADA
ncbi:HEAT repeat domain-containing protein [Robiginitalea sp. M366]|uniref:HEAT repeat domain-containing protein n=1 Tax=Robiginitalea aestuariiviva TaxID=3036903 RepID=UPI00240E50E1|nr:HEAT repeat domain-containing protein [Robiginitalea aestuariiviva]MDG1572942.1 HEAT repeat domain-containing protein [Robiginitalea aestuariiviva]